MLTISWHDQGMKQDENNTCWAPTAESNFRSAKASYGDEMSMVPPRLGVDDAVSDHRMRELISGYEDHKRQL